jgi:polysaccharide export outer membrane protein
VALVSGCAGPGSKIPNDEAAHRAIVPAAPNPDYILGPGDKLSVTVFGQADLSVPTTIVDPQGMVAMPLIGSLKAKGETTARFSKKIEEALSPEYLRQPDVTVNVVEYASKQVIVDGQVTTPSVLTLFGNSTLSQAIVRSGGLAQYAKADQVIIVREIDGQRMVARFDLSAIQIGQMDDPQIYAGDRIFVGYNSLKSFYQDALRTVPLIAIFQRF